MTTFPDSKLYIDGELRTARGGRTYDDIGPWTGQVIARAQDASAEDVTEAIAAARRAFDETDWSRQHATRLKVMTEFRDALLANRERLVEIARHEVGSALGAAYGAQVDGALRGASGLLEVFPCVKWEESRGQREDYGVITERMLTHEPIGVVGAITPWNVPFFINFAKVFSALLAGCTVVLKAAPETPMAAAIMGELAYQINMPRGVFNVISSSDPAMAGDLLVTDPRVDLISFTGSTAVGRRIMERGAATLKRVFLELGGKSAAIVLDDAPDFALNLMQSGGMVCYHAGQGCAIQTRLLVPKSRYQEALAVLKAGFEALNGQWGDFDNPSQIMGPVISRRQLDRILNYIEIGKKEGARLLAGGRARPDKGGGFFVEPTCFVDVDNSMRIAREEIFGPVVVVIPFEDDADAIRIANDSDYGLSGGVMSSNRERAMRIARGVRTGTISVNGGMCMAPDLPFGGYKGSGIGREWGREGIEEYLETKSIGIAA